MGAKDLLSRSSVERSESLLPGRLGRWVILIVALLIFVVLFLSGQLALVMPLQIAHAENIVGREADYGYWIPLKLQPVDPGIIAEIRQDERAIPVAKMAAEDYWPTPTQVLAEALAPTALPATATQVTIPPTATPISVGYNVPTATSPPTYQPPQVIVPTNTATNPPPTYTSTPVPTSTQAPPTSTPSRTPTLAPSRTSTRTPTRTPSHTSTQSPSNTPSQSPTTTATYTATFMPIPIYSSTPTRMYWTPTRTATPTNTPTFTSTPSPTNTRTVITPPPEVNIGPPDGTQYDLACGLELILDLDEPTWIETLVFYEFFNPDFCGGGICLDWVIIEVSDSDEGPWAEVFYWGDSVDGNNGDVLPYHYAVQEVDNENIHQDELYNGHGIQVPVNDTYRFVRVFAPEPCYDPAQIDAIDILP
jgi:hypothetical protein